LNDMRSEETVAEYSLTGIATRPKDIVSEAMDRACVGMSLTFSLDAAGVKLDVCSTAGCKSLNIR
jgi:hypothetical protein